ncbi:MAG: BREX-3 system phosphatase PglZ [Anaerolineae bacterium]|nr:BREX-3 system phosphatase PglZ [Anaerolineae bacterium]
MNWRDQILKEFPPQLARLTLVADPDSLMAEELISQELRARAYEVLLFENSLSFRFAYEDRYRTHWDRGESLNLVVILPPGEHDLRLLPYDVWSAGRKVSFSLNHLFPNLHQPVVAALERSDFDKLYQALRQESISGSLGDYATRDFVLRHVFEIAPELINQPSDLLHALLRRHYRQQRLPALLVERLINRLRQKRSFDDWPLEQLVTDRSAFLDFLGERWPVFLEVQASGQVIDEQAAAYLTYPGPALLPFDHEDVRVYVDSLFLEGLLQPVAHPKAVLLAKGWVKVGLRLDPKSDLLDRLAGLLKTVTEAAPPAEATYQDWLAFAYRWAELLVLRQQADPIRQAAKLIEPYQALQQQVDTLFLDWLRRRYGGLANQPALTPVMLHHVPRVMARYLEEAQVSPAKVALVVMDGLALDQWLVVREVLTRQNPNLKFQEAATFAWLPTITPVSRQAIFAGTPPLYFPQTIYQTDKEAGMWQQFWNGKGLPEGAVAYARGLSEPAHLARVEELASHPKVRVLGLVVDKVDKIMHGMELGTAGMHNQVRQWIEQKFVVELLNLLLDRNFGIFLTADHGNIEAVGCGSPTEGVVADIRGERVRVYPDPSLRAKVKEKFPNAIAWPPLGLPEDYLPLLAPHRSAFVQEGKRIVGHGGISVEELIVPFIQVTRRDL